MATNNMIHKLYRYRLASFELMAPGISGPIDLNPGSVNAIYISKDYDTNFYPIFSVTFVTNPKLKEYISMNRNEVRFHIRLVCEGYKLNGNQVGLEPESTEDVFNTIFMPIITDNVPFMDAAMYNATTEELNTIARNGGSINDLGGKNINGDFRETVTYYLYIERDLVNSKNVVNKVYSNTNIPTICADILSQNGFNAILMSPSENTSSISECIILPQNLLNVFQYLSDIYGMHSTGTTTFFDYRCVYILNKSGHPKAVEKGEYPTTIFSIQHTTSGESWLSGTFTENKNKEYHIFPDPHRVVIKNPGSVNTHIYGSSQSLINSRNKSISKIFGLFGMENQNTPSVSRVDNNTNENPYINSTFANTVQEGNMAVTMTIFDPYMWALTPNKEFIIHWVNSQVKRSYSGYYRIRRTDFLFNRNGEQLCLSANIDMTKKEDISNAIANQIEEEVTIKNPNSSSMNNPLGGIKI